jgi:hypothetical protein
MGRDKKLFFVSGAVISARARQNKARRVRKQKISKKRRSCYVESGFIGLGRRRADNGLYSAVRRCVRAYVRSSAVRPQLQNRRNDIKCN